MFKLNKDGGGYVVLHSFPDSVMDGANPMAGLLAGRDGDSTARQTAAGQLARNGTVFKLNADGSGYRVLHSFPVEPRDGRFPRSSLIEGRDGALYGPRRMVEPMTLEQCSSWIRTATVIGCCTASPAHSAPSPILKV